MKQEIINKLKPSWFPHRDAVASLLVAMNDHIPDFEDTIEVYPLVDGWEISLLDRSGSDEELAFRLVFKVTGPNDHVSYWKVPVWYDSYDGNTYDCNTIEWDNTFEVTPVEKMVTVWEKK